jgi:hypothetical protein
MERPSYRLLLIPILLLLGLCTFFCALGLVIPKQLARSAAPPEYPNSELINQSNDGGTDNYQERRLYRTSDDIPTVLAYMEKHMPGFRQLEESNAFGPAYHNSKCNKSWLAKLASLLTSANGVLPCTSVLIFEDPDSNSTLIRIWVDWPAP